MAGSSLAFLFMIVMNFLANYLPLNGVTTAEISDKYYNIFTPAGFTFIIWGVIYIALALLVIVLAWGVVKNRERPTRIISTIGPYFIVSSVLNGLWIFTWHYDLIVLSLVVMLALLISLLRLYTSLNRSPLDGGYYLTPFSIYLGWISVATIANIATLSVRFNWGKLGLSGEFWLTILLLLILGVTAYMVLRRNDLVYGFVILWALVGITVARWGEAGGLSYASGVSIVAAILVFLVLARKQFGSGNLVSD